MPITETQKKTVLAADGLPHLHAGGKPHLERTRDNERHPRIHGGQHRLRKRNLAR
jgi:hypothetical protein